MCSLAHLAKHGLQLAPAGKAPAGHPLDTLATCAFRPGKTVA